MSKSTPPTFHGFPVNTSLPLDAGDNVEDLEKKPLLRIINNISSPELIERIRYTVSLNLVGSVNFNPGRKIHRIARNGDIYDTPNACIVNSQRRPLYVLLKKGYLELDGCTPVTGGSQLFK